MYLPLGLSENESTGIFTRGQSEIELVPYTRESSREAIIAPFEDIILGVRRHALAVNACLGAGGLLARGGLRRVLLLAH